MGPYIPLPCEFLVFFVYISVWCIICGTFVSRFLTIICYNIQNMIKATGRIIRARYEQRALEKSTIAFPINIMKEPRYKLFLVFPFLFLFFAFVLLFALHYCYILF
jgi:hypothetical protein